MSQVGGRGPRRIQSASQDDPASRGRSSNRSVEGTVREALPNDLYTVELDNGQEIVSHVSGAVKPYMVRLLPGDRVTVELSPYDLSRGRITNQHR